VSPQWVMSAKLLDRFGKGVRAAPTDALIADLSPRQKRSTTYGLHQSLTTLGRGLHSSTSQLNPSNFWSLKPQQAFTSQFNLRRFANATSGHSPQNILTSSCKVDVYSAQKWLTLSWKVVECKPLTLGGVFGSVAAVACMTMTGRGSHSSTFSST